MELIINTYGAYIQRRGGLFRVKTGEDVQELSAQKIKSIWIGTSATFSTDAVELAIENNIDIVFLNKFGDPFGRIWHGRLGSTARIRRRQLEISATCEGLNLAVSWVRGKLKNQHEFLGNLRNRRTRKSKELTEKINNIKRISEGLDNMDGTIDEIRNSLMGIEGSAGRQYFSALNIVLPDEFHFDGRSRNPAKDYFNCLLNYSYGVLYGLVERACILTGLDPYVGIIHTDHYNKMSLVFDLIESYRIWADETVVKLFSERKVKTDMFDNLKNGFTLNKKGKAVLMGKFVPYLDESIRYKNRNIKRRDTIQLDCHRLAQELINSSGTDYVIKDEKE